MLANDVYRLWELSFQRKYETLEDAAESLELADLKTRTGSVEHNGVMGREAEDSTLGNRRRKGQHREICQTSY